MGFINETRTKLHEHFLEKELKNHHNSHASIDFDDAKSVGILFDGTLLTDREAIQKFARKLKSQGKEVKMLAYVDGDQKDGDFVFPHFTKKEVDWTLRPKSQKALEFAEHRFDILINLAANGVIPLEYIAALSKAKFRVGPSTDKIYCYELMIDTSKQTDTLSFLHQVTFFLNKMVSETH